jgi:CRISPR-associated protein Csy2
MNNIVGYLFLNRIKVQGANAISSPITYGFPALSGFLGAIHALNRKIEKRDVIHLDGILVACHDCQVSAYRQHDFADYRFSQARRPLKKKDGEYQSPPIIQEGKVNLVVSLMVEIKGERNVRRWFNEEENVSSFINEITRCLMQQRIAGGSILSVEGIRYFDSTTTSDQLKRSLLPAFVLMSAQKDLREITNQLKKQNPDATGLDALIETCKLHHTPKIDKTNEVKWTTDSVKKGRAWLVPISVGYQSISPRFEKNAMQNSRHPEYPSQYVECLYSLGKWVFPSSLGENQDQWFWRYSNQDNLYLINQF